MTNEEMERAISFIVNQQAQFSADHQKLTAGLQGLTEVQTQTEKTLAKVIDLLAQVTETQLRMAEAQKEVAEAQKRTDAALAEGSERLNSLIVVVERYFSNGRGNQ